MRDAILHAQRCDPRRQPASVLGFAHRPGQAQFDVVSGGELFRVIKADGEVNVLNTNYPPNENALYWTVSAEKAGPAVIRISYLIGNMAAEPSYQGIVENDEKKLLMQVYMTVTNTSGESLGECTVQPGVLAFG